MARPVAYGQANTVKNVIDVEAASSQSFPANGGKIVHMVSGRATVISGGVVADILGWAEVGNMSTSSTAGQDLIPVNTAYDATYEMPINATQTESQLRNLIVKTCDVETVSGVQYANYDASANEVLQIVGYKYYGSGSGEQSLIVRINWNCPSLTISGI